MATKTLFTLTNTGTVFSLLETRLDLAITELFKVIQ